MGAGTSKEQQNESSNLVNTSKPQPSPSVLPPSTPGVPSNLSGQSKQEGGRLRRRSRVRRTKGTPWRRRKSIRSIRR
jgi:hypothetical protein